MKTKLILIVYVILLYLVQIATSLLIEGAVIGIVGLGYAALRCTISECCNEDYVILNTSSLKDNLYNKLYGQQIAQNVIYSAIDSHVRHDNPKKPLVLSLHGLPGSGKNYVSTMIANALFKLGEKSTHYYFFNGRHHFPSNKDVPLYKHNLREKITNALKNCERSLFVFDEVDKMPPGILDVLVPFIDYTKWNNGEKNKSIFILLSNTGSSEILNRMLDLWGQGKKRNEVSLEDFESLITIGAFNEVGGLQKSATIESKLIDHHIPFLPMEEKHVILCIKDAFKHFGEDKPTTDMIKDVLKHVTYGPEPENLYSTAGCKRLDHKVSSIIYRNKNKF